jgi:hypothetical protein
MQRMESSDGIERGVLTLVTVKVVELGSGLMAYSTQNPNPH